MSRFSIPILFCTFLSLLAETPAHPPENIVFLEKAVFSPLLDDNSHLPPESYASFSQLQTWAHFQFYRLSPDSPRGGIQDGICRMIPKEGFRFYLKLPTVATQKKQNFRLHLDITHYSLTPRGKASPRVLQIFVNGVWKKRLAFPAPKGEVFPVEIELEPKEIQNGLVEVNLVPGASEVGRFWGIWDSWLEGI